MLPVPGEELINQIVRHYPAGVTVKQVFQVRSFTKYDPGRQTVFRLLLSDKLF